MHVARHYHLFEVLRWTRREVVLFVVVGMAPWLAHLAGVHVPPVPWQPIALLGTAVAFMTGFKSNAAYGRAWEARQIWGAIVNASRTWAMQVRDFIGSDGATDPSTHRLLIIRHIAWLTALRYQLREPRQWESARLRENVEFRRRTFVIPERNAKLEALLPDFLSSEDLAYVLARKNRATAVLALQSSELKTCAENGQLSEYRQVELARVLALMVEQQGKCERIKNFPYPRQYATLNLMFVWLFIVILPFGVLSEFKKLGDGWVWMTAPMTVIVAWVFHTMDKMSDATENPFEGGPNDVPISTMSRAIEIDLKDLLGDHPLPEPRKPLHDIAM